MQSERSGAGQGRAELALCGNPPRFPSALGGRGACTHESGVLRQLMQWFERSREARGEGLAYLVRSTRGNEL